MRCLFIAGWLGCSGPVPQGPAAPAPWPAPDARPVAVLVTHDAGPVTTLGAACSGATCGPDRQCHAFPNGYCTSPCGVAGGPCDGTCVETPRAGELCMASCTADAQCRAAEGYVCDRQWKACMIPNTAAIVPRDCGAPPGLGRDLAFAPTTPLSTATSPGVYQLEPSAVVTGDGGLVALYTTRAGVMEPAALGLARIDPFGRATTDLPFATGQATSFEPWLARGAMGKLYAVWVASDRDGARQIAMATSTDRGVTWSKPVAVHEAGDCSDPAHDCLGRPMVIVGPDPQRRGAQLVHVAYAANGLRMRASRDGGASFGSATTALAGSSGDLAVGADGTLYAIALNGGPRGGYGSADQRVEFTASTDGGRTFTRPQPISRHGELLPFFFAGPSIAVDDRRRWLYVAYTRGGHDGKWDLVIAASKDRGKTWTRTRIGDEPACAIHMVPELAVDPTTGMLHVAWYDSRGPRFAHAVCAPGATGCRQVGRINDVPFAALSTVRHGAKWIGERESIVVDSARRTLHAVWAQPVDEAGKIVTRIFHAKAKLPLR